ncbi:death-associated inhibitor of apoptosis 1-like [Phlebotomus papatasi]|uniref:death-associated inhibitor of apoptosis 1-like n=1 Tax=Phlebotomus papatasi TaxID=29031 RepID=UPI0024839C3A|nr:death-associated inhibitor of apoptosis 1-like [Phlebotomus papatasi]
MSDEFGTSNQSTITPSELSEILQDNMTLENSGSSQRYKNMHREEERLMSFTNWTVDCVDINELAMLGLYFLRPPDVVKCAFCDVELRYWISNEEVFMKHFLGNNDCPLLTLKDNNNVAINPEELDSVLISASYCSNMTLPDYSDEPEAIGDETTSTLEVECPVSCAYVQYETNEDRLATYDNWSSSFKKTPDELSEAGFFYSGIKDEVTCFSCGGSIAKWQEDYDIWEIHASQFSNCDYVQFVQSEEFIRNAKRKYAKWNNIPEEADLDLPSTSSNTTQNTLEITSQTQESSNRSIYLDKSCKVCYIREYNTAFVPCGHVLVCMNCATKMTICSLCNTPITSIVEIRLS